MVKILGETTVNLLISTLLGVLGFIVLRDFDQGKRIASLEARIVGEARVAALESRVEVQGERLTLMLEELTRVRDGVFDLIMPVFAKLVEGKIDDYQDYLRSRDSGGEPASD